MKKIVFMFDGQGAFKPGVGKELCSKYKKAKQISEKSSEILGYNLADHLWGAQAIETSSRTSIAQPAISTVSLAYAAVLKDIDVTADISLGHSLGELTAVVYCNIVTVEDGIKIIQKRGELMEKGGKEGSMMAIINMDQTTLNDICQKISKEISKPVVIANINTPNQIVISGSKVGLKKAAQLVTQNHGRVIPLKVGGAWHSPYLHDAAKEFSAFLDTVKFYKPTSPFYSVVDQKILEDGELIKESLKKQMLAQVNWVRAIENLKNMGYTTFLEIGPSKILKDLVSKINADVKAESAALFTDLAEIVENL